MDVNPDAVYGNLSVVTGGSGSGKSAFAEDLVLRRQKKEGGRLIYLATMHRADDSETQQRIARHRALRSGRGFLTIEAERNIADTLRVSPQHLCILPGDHVLLEDLGNLLANEMFSPFGGRTPEQIVQDILIIAEIAGKAAKTPDGGSELSAGTTESPICRTGSLTVVTNEVGDDGAEYTSETKNYILALNKINRELVRHAAYAVRTICGLPLVLRSRTQSDFL